MCKKGDIILVRAYKDGDNLLGRHSFVVLEDKGGRVCGLNYDIIALVMSSFKNEEQKAKKLRYPGNFEVTASSEQLPDWAHGKDGYIKAEQFYYFDKSKLDFTVIGSLTKETWQALLDFIELLSAKGIEIQQILDNIS